MTDQPGRFRLHRAWSLAVAAFCTTVGFGEVLTVDDDDPNADFSDIQSAVDAAVDGDLIEVGPGYYFRTDPDLNPVVRIVGKSLEIKATALDPADTVLAGQGTRRCLEWTDADGVCRIIGFTFDSGLSNDGGGGADILNTRVQFQNCVFDACRTEGDGGAIRSRSAAATPPLAFTCRFVGNRAAKGGAVQATGGFDFIQCELVDNIATGSGGGVQYEGDPAGEVAFSVVSATEFSGCRGEMGGGIDADEANLMIFNTEFVSCTAADVLQERGYGGGLAVTDGSAELVNTDFDGCSSAYASGGLDLWNSRLVANECTFNDCSAVRYAGALNGYGRMTTIDLTGCTFTDNTVWEGEGGAIGCAQDQDVVSDGRSLVIGDCSFTNNLAIGTGYCIHARNVVVATDCVFGAARDDPNAFGGVAHVDLIGEGTGSRFTGCRFTGGRSIDLASSIRATDAGGLEFTDCTFDDNRTTNVGLGPDSAGAVFIDANPDSNAAISFHGCEFRDNGGCCLQDGFFSGTGGALAVVGRTADIAFCTFSSNRATEGGSIFGAFRISNSDISGLASLGYGGAAYLLGGSTLTDCKISGTADCNYPWIYATGPISIDRCTMSAGRPEGIGCFPDPAELAGCRLVAGTTVRDTRFCSFDPAAIFGDWDDLGGNSFNPDECNFADLDGDGEVNGADLAAILVAWGQPCRGCPADVNDDGEVDGADLAAVLAAWR